MKARAALELANAPNEFLSTVQIGITLVGILAGAFGGATIAETLAGMLVRVPWLAPYRKLSASAWSFVHHLSVAHHRRAGAQAAGLEQTPSRSLPTSPAPCAVCRPSLAPPSGC